MFFTTEFCDEASGSVHYITEDGSINYEVILKAVHLVMLNSKEQDVGIQVWLYTCISNIPNSRSVRLDYAYKLWLGSVLYRQIARSQPIRIG